MKLSTVILSLMSVTCVTAAKRGEKEAAFLFSFSPRKLGVAMGMMSRSDQGGSGNKDSNDNGGNKCDLCFDNNKGDALQVNLRYDPLNAQNSMYQPADKANCIVYEGFTYPTEALVTVRGKNDVMGQVNVTDGEEFAVDGSLSAFTFFDFGVEIGPGMTECFIHTSCSVPLIPGDHLGPFIIVGQEENCGATDGECEICESMSHGEKPTSITFEYNAVGQDSLFQPEDKASCRAGTYPSPANIKVYDKSGDVIATFDDIETGQMITLDAPAGADKFDAFSFFEFSGWGGGTTDEENADVCFIHTSCSVPLMLNDQIGPLIVREGGMCKPETGKCVEVEQAEYECGPDMEIKIAFDWSKTPNGEEPNMSMFGWDDWFGIYPCDIPEFKHAESWLWACGEFGTTSRECSQAKLSGGLTFQNPMPEYNDPGNHDYPVAPFLLDDNVTVNTCFQVALLRLAGPSTPPYVKICESQKFDILPGSCEIRGSSHAYPHMEEV